MNSNVKIYTVGSLIVILLIVGIYYANEISQRNHKRSRAITDAAWQQCIDAGGIPIGSWHSSTVLSDCVLLDNGGK